MLLPVITTLASLSAVVASFCAAADITVQSIAQAAGTGRVLRIEAAAGMVCFARAVGSSCRGAATSA
jgi:hypothetical protein